MLTPNQTMPEENFPELRNWLHEATMGLSAEIADRFQEEIVAHYHDCLQDYLGEGTSPQEAHKLTMGQLGPSCTAHRYLHEAHAPKKLFRMAALSSLFAPVLLVLTLIGFLLLLPYSHYRGTFVATVALIYLFQTVALALTSWLTFRGLRLLVQRFDIVRVSVPIRLWIAGLGLLMVFMWMLFVMAAWIDQAFISSTGEYMPPQEDLLALISVAGVVLQVILIAGIVFLSLGLIQLGRYLSRINDDLYGLKNNLSSGLSVTGVLLMLFLLSRLIPLGISEVIGLVFILNYLVSNFMLAALFLRAIHPKRQFAL